MGCLLAYTFNHRSIRLLTYAFLDNGDSAEKMSELLKAHGISEDEIIAEFDAMRKQARRDATK